MVFCIVFTFMCLHITKTACRPIEDQVKEVALKLTVDNIQVVIQKALHHLTIDGLLPDISCMSLNTMKQVNISSSRCYIQKLSKRTPELSEFLDICSQYLQDAEQLRFGRVMHVACSLPSFEQDHYNYLLTKCLLQFLDEQLGAKDGKTFL